MRTGVRQYDGDGDGDGDSDGGNLVNDDDDESNDNGCSQPCHHMAIDGGAIRLYCTVLCWVELWCVEV